MQYDEDEDILFPAADEFQLGDATAAVLAVVPDVCLDHLAALLHKHKETEVVVNELLERPYPKNRPSPSKGKKRARSEDPSEEQERDWLNVKERGETSEGYRGDALEQLCVDFRLVPKGAIRTALVTSSHCYSPAFVRLQQEFSQSEDERGWKNLKVGRGGSKGKDKEVVLGTELAKELVWLKKRLGDLEKEKREEEREREEGLLVECACCYGEFSFQHLYQCSEGHLFCGECAIALANTQIELQRFTLPCMDDGCTAFFPEVEAARFLSRGMLEALRRLKQQSEIDQAGLEGLEKCPFCPYCCVIDNPEEKLLVCRRGGCEITSCRNCKKEEHLPKSCAEMIKDNDIHAVEDAMSAALIRKCPKCLLPYLKLSGCNYITCSGCGAGSCYVCQQLCPKSTEHYDMAYNPAGGPSIIAPGKKCPLYDFDNSTAADLKAVEAARLEASALVMNYNKDISLADVDRLKVVA